MTFLPSTHDITRSRTLTSNALNFSSFEVLSSKKCDFHADTIEKGVVVKKNKKTGAAKFKVRCSRYLYVHVVNLYNGTTNRLPATYFCLTVHRLFRYTLVVDDKDKAAKFERDLPKALSPSEYNFTFDCCILLSM